ncbi:MAG: LPP20 family lipoprotein [Rickettsiales bacterium]|nr:LPP20 family lipoprotein [Rickettsiales bacterium]
MKKFTSLLAIILFSLTFACSGTKTSPNPKITGNLSNLPEWVVNPAVEDGVGGVGIAGPSKGGLKFQIPRAQIDAKANIAATIQAEISRITKSSLRSADINNDDDIEEFFAQATKEVVKNLPLSGVRRVAMFKSEDGSLYVHMVLKNEDYTKFLENSEKTFAARAAKLNIGRENINKAQEATKDLFDELEKERK